LPFPLKEYQTNDGAPAEPGGEERSLCQAIGGFHVCPNRSLSVQRTQVQDDCGENDHVQNPRKGNKKPCPWVTSPCECQAQGCLIANQLRNPEDIVQWVRVSKESYPRSRQCHEPCKVCSPWGAAGLNGPITNGRGENKDAGCNATQHDGKGNSGRGTNLSNLADRLMHVTIAGNHQGQSSYAKSKYDSGYRSEQQPIIDPHLEPKVIEAGNRSRDLKVWSGVRLDSQAGCREFVTCKQRARNCAFGSPSKFVVDWIQSDSATVFRKR